MRGGQTTQADWFHCIPTAVRVTVLCSVGASEDAHARWHEHWQNPLLIVQRKSPVLFCDEMSTALRLGRVE